MIGDCAVCRRPALILDGVALCSAQCRQTWSLWWKPCKKCTKPFPITDARRRFCEPCRKESRKAKNRRKKEPAPLRPCERCGIGFKAQGRQEVCDPCKVEPPSEAEVNRRLRQAEERRRKAASTLPPDAVPCGRCAHGEAMAESTTGWACRASLAMRCRPLAGAVMFKSKEQAV